MRRPANHRPSPDQQEEPHRRDGLAFLLGGIGAHQFYLGRIGRGSLPAVLLTFIPGIVALVDGFILLANRMPSSPCLP